MSKESLCMLSNCQEGKVGKSLCIIFILDCGNDVRKKVNPSDFLIRVQNGSKAETTCNINNVFGPGTFNECTMQWWFKKFCKGDESLEDEEHSGSH